jgi:glycerophosphoryl diester phosphodiesterase
MKNITNRDRWKRKILWAAFLVLLIGGLVALVFTRFHFSNQDFPSLASWQGNDESLPDSAGARPQIIGHRGSGFPAIKDGKRLDKDGKDLMGNDSPLLIGNTAAAIRRGIEAGVDWIEIDIRASSDKKLVVFHDEKIDLKTTGSGKIENLSLETIQKSQILVDPPERIMSLEDVFSRFHSEQRKWIFDIKAAGIQKEVLGWIEGKVSTGELLKDRFVLFGRHDVLLDYKESGYNRGYTVTWGHEEGMGNRLRALFTPSRIINRCETLGCQVLVLPTIFANRSLVGSARSKGLSVWIYGSDDQLDHKHFAGRAISGLIVDDPENAMDCFEGRSPTIEPFGAEQAGRTPTARRVFHGFSNDWLKLSHWN